MGERSSRLGQSEGLAAPPWWTAADQAELDLLVHELVRTAFVHRAGCAICGARGLRCAAMAEALEGLLEWRRGRELRSKVAWLRARQVRDDEPLAPPAIAERV